MSNKERSLKFILVLNPRQLFLPRAWIEAKSKSKSTQLRSDKVGTQSTKSNTWRMDFESTKQTEKAQSIVGSVKADSRVPVQLWEAGCNRVSCKTQTEGLGG